MNDPLASLARTGQLKVQPTSKTELAGFLANAEQSLADARIAAVSSANRFKLAYDAPHALALAAVRARGYRPGAGPGHAMAEAYLALREGQAAVCRALLQAATHRLLDRQMPYSTHRLFRKATR